MDHFQRLKRMYGAAPIHKFYEGIEISIGKNESEINLPIDQRYFHAGMSTHGSVYFKLLDDAAYFAAQSEVKDCFLVTSNFNINLLRPIKSGRIIAIGEVDLATSNIVTASSKLYDKKGRLCGTGSGQFVKSRVKLEDVQDY